MKQDFIIYPNVPMETSLLVTVLGTLALFVMISGVVFASVGAWPVTGFLGLDLLGIGWALWWTQRQARICERLRIEDGLLIVEQTQPSGIRQVNVFEKGRVQILPPDIRGRGLRIHNDQRAVSVGRFLSLGELRDLERALSRALST